MGTRAARAQWWGSSGAPDMDLEMKPSLLILLSAFAMSACSSPLEPAEHAPPIAGGDRDVHGCRASAGYTWSALRGECIRIFEAGLAFEPDPLPAQGAVLAAFVVLAPAQGGAVTAAEAFLPGRKEPIPLSVVHTAQRGDRATLLVNPAGDVRVYRHQNQHILEAHGQRYRRNSPPDDRLFSLR